jgi:putative addiction module component (TIGR02574 family)
MMWGMATVDELLAGALRLPTEERARLARELLLSLEDEPTTPGDTDSDWGQELERRAQDVLNGRVRLETLEEVQRAVAERLERVRQGR